MITNDTQLRQAQADIQTIWRFLESARQTHASLDYQHLASPYLLQLQEWQQAVVAYLTQHTVPQRLLSGGCRLEATGESKVGREANPC